MHFDLIDALIMANGADEAPEDSLYFRAFGNRSKLSDSYPGTAGRLPTPFSPFDVVELKLKSSHYMRVKALATHCGTECPMRIFNSAAQSIFSVIAVSLPWLLFIVWPSILFGHAMTAFLWFGAINGIGLIFLGSAVFIASALRIGRRWWWAMFGACLSANVAYWLIRSIYFPDPPPPDASPLYFEYEPFFALFGIPTVLVAMIVGANFDRLFSRVSPTDPQRLNGSD